MKLFYIILILVYFIGNLYGVYLDKTDYSYTNITKKHTVVVKRDIPKVDKKKQKVILDQDHDGVVDQDDKCPNTIDGVCVDQNGCVSKVKRVVHFNSDSYIIDTKSKQVLKDIVSIAHECFGYKIVLKGYTDSTASETFNQKLSKQRVQSIKTTLLNCGIKSDRITIKWYGESNPIASNQTKEGRYENRRVEILFY